MKRRRRSLPPGWYPGSAIETEQEISDFVKKSVKMEQNAVAGIVPHAGWAYSGKIALEVIQNLTPDIDTVIVIGGHLAPDNSILAAFEDEFETPIGTIMADKELLREMKKEIKIDEDRNADNTVEIQLPLVKYCFPESSVLWMRVAPSSIAIELGKAIDKVSRKIKRKVSVIGSTDLTHYGSNYRFAPQGSGKKALKWVKEVNDKNFIDNIINLELKKAYEHANRERSACSAGGAVAAASFAKEKGVKEGKLLSYLTSYDVYPNESFVGYAGIVFCL